MVARNIARTLVAAVSLAGALVAGISAEQQSARAAGTSGTVLITGSNRGLGLEFTRQYADRGWKVIATARNPATATELRAIAAKNRNVTVDKLDVADVRAIKALAAKYKDTAIDVLINNAGVLGDMAKQGPGSFDKAEFDNAMGVNVFGADCFNRRTAGWPSICSMTCSPLTVTVAGCFEPFGIVIR